MQVATYIYMESLIIFQLLTANHCGMVFVENPRQMFMTENNIIMPKFPFNEYQIKNNCLEMSSYPQIFRSEKDIVLRKEPYKHYNICFFNLSPSECQIIEDNN